MRADTRITRVVLLESVGEYAVGKGGIRRVDVFARRPDHRAAPTAAVAKSIIGNHAAPWKSCAERGDCNRVDDAVFGTLDDGRRNVVERAKDCIIDTVAVATFGARFPWSRMVADYAV